MADARLRSRRPCPRGPAACLGRVLHRPPAGGGRHPGRPRDGPRHDRRRADARRGRRHRHHQRGGRRAVRGRDRGPGRRRHQADPHPLPVQGGRAGREPAQDVPGHGQGHPGHHHQAGRPPAQHAHARQPAGSQAAVDRPRDDRDLRPDRAPAGHLAGQVGPRGPGAALPRSRVVPRHRRAGRQEARRARGRRSRTSSPTSRPSSPPAGSRPTPPAGPSTSTRSTRRCARGATSRPSTTSPRCASSSTRSRTATRRWAWCTPCGSRSRAASKTTSRCPSPTCTSRCTRRWWARAASRSRCRSAPGRCTAPASTASPRTGATKKAARRTTSSRS